MTAKSMNNKVSNISLFLKRITKHVEINVYDYIVQQKMQLFHQNSLRCNINVLKMGSKQPTIYGSIFRCNIHWGKPRKRCMSCYILNIP